MMPYISVSNLCLLDLTGPQQSYTTANLYRVYDALRVSFFFVAAPVARELRCGGPCGSF